MWLANSLGVGNDFSSAVDDILPVFNLTLDMLSFISFINDSLKDNVIFGDCFWINHKGDAYEPQHDNIRPRGNDG